LIETSAPLIARQRERLVDAPMTATWAADLTELPDDRPIILIANELLDCLPIRQLTRTPQGLAERVVGLDEKGELGFGLIPLTNERATNERAPAHARVGEIFEVSPAQTAFAEDLGARIVAQGGAALLIDYGRDRAEPGDTLQALLRHRKVDPLAEPGAADLTAHADFPAVLRAAREGGAQTALVGQGDFLRRLGIETRARALSRARPDRAETIARQLARLTDADQMGVLFKAACLFAPAQPIPPGFEDPR
jgi:SAM-dependent MidA family methyltransferase